MVSLPRTSSTSAKRQIDRITSDKENDKLTLVGHVEDDVAGVDVDDDERPQGGALLLGQLAPDQLHHVAHLGLQLAVQLAQTILAVLGMLKETHQTSSLAQRNSIPYTPLSIVIVKINVVTRTLTLSKLDER